MATTQTDTVTLTVTLAGPTIDTDPQDTTVDEFTTATFTVAATSSGGALSYQWYDSAVGLLAGETTDTLAFVTAASQQGYTYYCKVADDNGATDSASATLTVTDIPNPVITDQPDDVFLLDGTTAQFIVAATGADPLTYQWSEITAGELVGETLTTLSFIAVAADAGKQYFCVVTDTHGQTTQTDNALITIVSAPVFVTDPVDTTAIEYRDVSFTAAAVGNVPITYEWYDDVTGLIDTGDTLTFAVALTDAGNTYWAVARDTYGFETTSATALLKVEPSLVPNDPPFIDGDIYGPNDIFVPYGQGASFTITVTGQEHTPPYTVDWYNDRDGLVLADGGDTFTYVPTLPDDKLNWSAVVTDAIGELGQSRQALLTLVPSVLDLSWSVEDAQEDTTVSEFTSIAWGLFDARTADDLLNFKCPLRTHRGLTDDGKTYWIPFYDKSARCSRGTLVNDRYNRYYWTQDGQAMKYAPLSMLQGDSFTTGLDVGVPPPASKPLVIPPEYVEDTDIVVDRAYVYTYVTIYGEEGPPSEATVASGVDSGVWEISNMATGPVLLNKDYKITTKKLYRSVSVGGQAEYHFVAAMPLLVTTYSDANPTSDVATNYTLESEDWDVPPEELSGLIAHPNGFFVGFVGRDLYFSEPYRPHAWPSKYVLSTIGDIVGLGVFGTTILVCTNSFPYTVTGIHPSSMVLTKHDTAEPCLSRYGIVSMPFGVYYPGPNGLMLASPRGLQNATEKLLTKEEWQNRYQVTTLDAARYQQQYVAFYQPTKGLMFDPGEPLAALVDLDLIAADTEPDSMDTIFTDEYSGKTFIIDNCEMYEWNPVSGAPLEYDWTSMEFDIPNPANFGAARIIWYSDYTPPTPEETWAYRIYNEARIAEDPLNPFNYHAINMVKRVPWDESGIGYLTYDLTVLDAHPEIDPDDVQKILDAWDATETLGQIKQPLHWSPLIWVPKVGEKWPNTPFVIMELIVNETVVYTKEVTHTKMFRLPPGFKGTRFRIRLRSNINIQSCKIAETGKELAHI